MFTDPELASLQSRIVNHSLFARINSVAALQIFMQSHVYCVWDFMWLLKRLQRQLTVTHEHWRPSPFPPELRRFINEIVLGEESDEAANNRSHFEWYLAAMAEVDADTSIIQQALEQNDPARYMQIPLAAREHLLVTGDIATHGQLHEVAAAFSIGREKLIPSMFPEIINHLTQAKGLHAPTLLAYLDRHVSLDGDEHGPMSDKLLTALCDTSEKQQQALVAAKRALSARLALWDAIEDSLLMLAKSSPAVVDTAMA
jgi:hypothetical protein